MGKYVVGYINKGRSLPRFSRHAWSWKPVLCSQSRTCKTLKIALENSQSTLEHTVQGSTIFNVLTHMRWWSQSPFIRVRIWAFVCPFWVTVKAWLQTKRKRGCFSKKGNSKVWKHRSCFQDYVRDNARRGVKLSGVNGQRGGVRVKRRQPSVGSTRHTVHASMSSINSG